MAMNNDTEIISRFIKVEQGKSRLNILACSISWPHPHEPLSNWTVAAALPLDSSSGKIDSEIQAVLINKDYFQVCQECGQRKPCGWMHNDAICQGCAEKNHSVVY